MQSPELDAANDTDTCLIASLSWQKQERRVTESVDSKVPRKSRDRLAATLISRKSPRTSRGKSSRLKYLTV